MNDLPATGRVPKASDLLADQLRTLESEGLIAIRPGRGGGSSVCRPTRDLLERSVSLFIRGQRVRPAGSISPGIWPWWRPAIARC